MSSNYPPGITGNEPEIIEDEPWNEFFGFIEYDINKYKLSAEEAMDIWMNGLQQHLNKKGNK